MPQNLILKPEFQAAVTEALQGLSVNQASYKTGISYEWLRRMVKYGHVPSEEIIERLAEGLGADLHSLRIAAGYEEETDILKRTDLFLNGSPELSEFTKDEIRRLVQEAIEKSQEKKQQ